MCDRQFHIDNDAGPLGGDTGHGAYLVFLGALQQEGGCHSCHTETLANARRRIEEENQKVLGVRFKGDVLFCRAAQFQTLRRELGDGFEGIELPASTPAPHLEPPHSVLTIGSVDREGELPRPQWIASCLSCLNDAIDSYRSDRPGLN